MLKQKKKRDCCCSGHPSGRPKYSTGPCFGWCLRPAVVERKRGKRLERIWKYARNRDDVDD